MIDFRTPADLLLLWPGRSVVDVEETADNMTISVESARG